MRMICTMTAGYCAFSYSIGVWPKLMGPLCVLSVCNSVYFSVREAIRDERKGRKP